MWRRVLLLLNLFRARPGWRGRIQQFHSGAILFDGPSPGSKRTTPWPYQWIAHRLLGPGEADESGSGWSSCAITCSVTGEAVPQGGVCCARCGCPLSEAAAGMSTRFSVPSCPACRPFVSRA